MSEQQITIQQEPEFDVNEVQAQLTASKVLISILETIGQVSVPTRTLFEANNKDKELVVDYDETGPNFIFRLPKPEELEYNANFDDAMDEKLPNESE
jgi:hypothetical protein